MNLLNFIYGHCLYLLKDEQQASDMVQQIIKNNQLRNVSSTTLNNKQKITWLGIIRKEVLKTTNNHVDMLRHI